MKVHKQKKKTERNLNNSVLQMYFFVSCFFIHRMTSHIYIVADNRSNK